MQLLRALRASLATLVLVAASAAWGGLAQASFPSTTTAAALAATCTSSVGPGIPPPASVPSGIPGFHAAWYGQSGYMTLCPGDTASATVAIYNSGSFGWVSGVMGQVAYLGTWNPSPGQDQPSVFGGDGTMGSPNTGWPRYNRVATQPASYVGPNQVSWFQFGVKAPSTPGSYGFYIRPLVEGAQWMEDYGIFWTITVPSSVPDTTPPSVTGASTTNTGTVLVSYSEAMKCSTDGALSSIATGTNYQITTNPGGTVVAETITATPNSACTQATLTLSNPLTLGGQYTVTASNAQDSAGNSISSSGRSANFTVTRSTVTGASATNATAVNVTYSANMDPVSAQTAANYGVQNPAGITYSTVTSAVCSPSTTSCTSVNLTLGTAMTNGSYNAVISNVKDTFGNTIVTTTQPFTFTDAVAPTVTGAMRLDANNVWVNYSKRMTGGSSGTNSAGNTTNYQVNNFGYGNLCQSGGTATITATADLKQFTITCTGAPGVWGASGNTLTVGNAADYNGNVITPNPSSVAF